MSCEEGLTNCWGITCKDLDSDLANCGACGQACAPGEICNGGSCELTCKDGLVECDGACRDTNTDRNHCGECSNACPSDSICVDGTCRLACGVGLVECDGACRDLETDRTNCGECGRGCSGGQICSDGTCTSCGAGRVACGNECVDTSTMQCANPVDMGALSRPGSAIFSDIGRLPLLGKEAWYAIEFPPGSGVPKIEFDLNEGGVYRLAVFPACGDLPFACDLGLGRDVTYYRFEDGCGYCSSTGVPYPCGSSPWPESVLVRVTMPLPRTECYSYRLKFSR